MSCNHHFTICHVCGYRVDIPFHTEDLCEELQRVPPLKGEPPAQSPYYGFGTETTAGTPVWPQQGFSKWLDGSYDSEEGGDDYPPIHPNCRCELEPEKTEVPKAFQDAFRDEELTP